ncbi:MAG: MerR family transcriptional regulator [Candidatus Berkiella sp.]
MKIGDLAKKTGLTVRTLHHYDEISLVKPSGRSTSGHRIYHAKDILRLQKALALSQLGLSLAQIKECLDANTLSFHDIAQKQMKALEEKMASLSQLHHRLQAMSSMYSEQDAIPVEELIKTIEVMIMYEKYYTPEQLNKLRARQAQYTPEQFKAIEKRWENVFMAIKTAFADGKSENDSQVIELGKEANALIDEFTGKDPELEKSMQHMYSTEGGSNILQHHHVQISEEEFNFLKLAMIKAKA